MVLDVCVILSHNKTVFFWVLAQSSCFVRSQWPWRLTTKFASVHCGGHWSINEVLRQVVFVSLHRQGGGYKWDEKGKCLCSYLSVSVWVTSWPQNTQRGGGGVCVTVLFCVWNISSVKVWLIGCILNVVGEEIVSCMVRVLCQSAEFWEQRTNQS